MNEPTMPSRIVPPMPIGSRSGHEEPGERAGDQADDDQAEDESDHGDLLLRVAPVTPCAAVR